jgi:O-6-methylguanine DNA methyltransferase
MVTFKQKVIDVVKKIKKGSTLTYSQVATLAGNRKAYRAVGTIMAKNQDVTIPCHRVVKSDGSLGSYNLLQGESKEEILKKEGVRFSENGKVVLH